MVREGFDNNAYIEKQSAEISKRIALFGGKLYLEFGGKLFDDYHASRVLPGFLPDSKLQMLKKIDNDVEIVIVINAADIEKNKMRRDLGISYNSDVFRLLDAFSETGLFVGSVVITQFDSQPNTLVFKNQLERLGIKVFLHYTIEGYPYNIKHIFSDGGFGKNEYIETSRPLVVITAPGPGSGKMATCLSQLYHEHQRGIQAGYAKFETFPIWNLPLKHPVNLAYEAATADLNDVNMIDPYHMEAYGKLAINYNRDVEVFPVLNEMFERIAGKSPYRSPTDMGVNMAGYCFCDDEKVRRAASDEIIRRYFATLCDIRKGRSLQSPAEKIEMLMKQLNISEDDRPVVSAAFERAQETENQPAVAIELPDGTIVTGKTSPLLGASAAALLNAVKHLCNMEKALHLIDPCVIEPIQTLKTGMLGGRNPRLHSDEVLIALSISAASSEYAKRAMECLPRLRGCEAHSTVMLAQVDEDVYRKLGLNLTCEPQYQKKKHFYKY
ncbi:MAG: DUF1846 domain-containing protein [Oscillospiraceae bacterium]|nr:DUF1846 domain-containing protein [Oscillospiraceae bacterium]